MRLVFYAQVEEAKGQTAKPGELIVVQTTKYKPTGPKGHVIKFDIQIPEGVLYPEVRANLVGLETATEQVATSLRAAAASLKKPATAVPKGKKP